MSCKLATFGDHRHCGSGDIRFLVSYTIHQDHEIEGSFDLMEAIGSVVVEIKWF